MSTPARYTVTAALPYANGPVHIGHLAGCYLPADIYVRYLRQQGRDVLFICGSDEHGVPITIKARKEGISPKEVVDRYHAMMKQSFADFGIQFDIYHRTSSPEHHETAQDFFLELYHKQVFTEGVTEQYFDPEVGIFLADRYIVGTCPVCSNENAYGDQCEQCGTSLSPTELKNPRSALSGSTPVLKPTKNWFLPLDTLQPKIAAFLQSRRGWKPNVMGQCKSWLETGEGLQPRAMTRDLDWGVPVPLPDAEGKVLYVWFDAPIGYISATKALKPKGWEPYWKSADTKLVHFIGKDNIVFHCIIFPAMLMEHGGFILPDNVPANEFLNLEGRKISTSRNWAVWLHEYLEDFPGKQDVLRYALCATAPESKDNDFTWKDFQSRNNSELVAILGNFINRVMVLMHKFYGGVVPAEPYSAEDQQVLDAAAEFPARVANSIEAYRFREGLAHYMDLARLGNKYLADTEPWKLIKAQPERAAAVMRTAAQLAAELAVLGRPFLPHTADVLEGMLQWNAQRTWEGLQPAHLIPAGHVLGQPALLFDKIEDSAMDLQLAKLQRNEPEAAPNKALKPMKSAVTFDDFSKMDLRIGTILTAHPVPKTEKLMHLQVDTGLDQREIVSGIAQHFSAEELIGKQVLVLINLEPRMIKGIASQGMLLLAEDEAGKLILVGPQGPLAPGATVA
jgi:methionyl-tRNA synthetase